MGFKVSFCSEETSKEVLLHRIMVFFWQEALLLFIHKWQFIVRNTVLANELAILIFILVNTIFSVSEVAVFVHFFYLLYL
jgi:hypothetical protein